MPVLSTGVQVTDLAYADDVTLMASCLRGCRRLIDVVCQFCAPMGMIVSVAKTKIMVFNTAFLGPFQWTCGGQQLEIVAEYKYLGILFNAVHGMAVTFPMLKRNYMQRGPCSSASMGGCSAWPRLALSSECMKHVFHQQLLTPVKFGDFSASPRHSVPQVGFGHQSSSVA